MGRDISTVEVTITLDLKDRCGITRFTGLPVGKITQTGVRFKFTELDANSVKEPQKADEVFDKYFCDIIYPAVQAWRLLERNTRVNVNITLTWTKPYAKTYTKYYTGEYITLIASMPKFRAIHHAYYVARALFSATPIKQVCSNLACCYDRLYVPVESYEYVKQIYGEAKAIANKLCKGKPVEVSYDIDIAKVVFPKRYLINYHYGCAKHPFIAALYDRSPDKVEDLITENGIIQF